MQTLSWITTAISLFGNLLVNNQRKEGFIVWIISNILWIWIGLSAETINWGQVFLFMVYTGTSVHGLVTWIRKEKAAKLAKAV